MKTRAHSASSIKTLEQCELQYYKRYEEKGLKVEDPDPDHASQFGSSVHKAMECLYKLFMEKKPEKFSNSDYEHVYSKFIDAAAENKVNDIKLLEEGWSIIRHRMDTFDYKEKVIAVEKEFSLKTKKGTAFLGYIDKVLELSDDTLVIVDYKTSKTAATQKEADSDIQLSMYDLAASILWPKYKTVILVLDYMRLRQVMSYRTREQRNMFKDFLDSTDGYIKNKTIENIVPKLNSLCGWCAYRRECPAFIKASTTAPEILKSITHLSNDSLIEEFKKLNYIRGASENALKTVKMKLEQLTKNTNGSLVGTKEQIVASQSTRLSYDVADLVRVIPDRDLLKLCTVNKASLDDYVSSCSPEVAEKIRKMATVSYTSAFFRVGKLDK